MNFVAGNKFSLLFQLSDYGILDANPPFIALLLIVDDFSLASLSNVKVFSRGHCRDTRRGKDFPFQFWYVLCLLLQCKMARGSQGKFLQ